MTAPPDAANPEALEFHKLDSDADFPDWTSRDQLERFFHETMKPYHDSVEDVRAALDYALVPGQGQGGFVMLCHRGGQLLGALAMLETGMKGYVPEHILLFVSVDPEARGQGVGKKLIERSLAECPGDVKLHVEYDNPAKRLYERLGFTSKYAEMRYKNPRRGEDG
jgi:ribosomal protein S18 acetylase RimI-like enzyme